MEEKKLTDEEIIKALDICTTADDDMDCTDDCPMYEWNYCTVKLMRYACDLIHRLQAENETLKSNKFGMWKVKFFKAQEEIEAWKAKSRELEQSWEIASSNEEKLRKQADELKGQNEWLTNENTYLKQCADAFLGDYKNSVKDTAKEILQIIKEEYGYIGNLERIIAERYGVDID